LVRARPVDKEVPEANPIPPAANFFPLPWWEGIKGRGEYEIAANTLIFSPPP
jgi:hypothetical protein